MAPTAQKSRKARDPYEAIGNETLLRIHDLMVRSRLLEERLIKMSKGGEGFFWIGGPGEEAFQVVLGLLVQKGHGPAFDYLHLHYRSSALVLALGGQVIDTIRQMRTAGTDPYSKGRNFVNHYAIPEWNIVPVSPTIETQYATAIGTGIAQARAGGEGITIVTGGDAGSAEGDFHSCLVWANRPALPLPVLITVSNNGYGISTPAAGQHGEKRISDWAKPFAMPGATVDGNDPVAVWGAVQAAMDYCRSERKPYLLEALVSRLYGHSSSSGANRIEEPDCIARFETQLQKRRIADEARLRQAWAANKRLVDEAYEAVKREPYPDPRTIWDDVFPGGLPPSYPTRGGS